MIEIRLYFECLEQAKDYILPIISNLKLKNLNFKLIKRPKKAKQFKKGAMFSILSLATPDVLITAVKNNIEYPLAFIEFSEAVKTEDHELQRTYGAVAACLSNCFYIKISGYKESEKEFGGALYDPYSTPKIFKEALNYRGYIIAEWKTDDGDKYNLKRNSEYPSCPPEIPILNDVIESLILEFHSNHEDWFVKSVESLNLKNSFLVFIGKVENANGSVYLLEEWRKRQKANKNLNKLRYFVNSEFIAAKINRFSHAMDPDRGILNFISFVFSEHFKIYGIYALVRPRGGKILKSNLTSIKDLRSKLKNALKKDKGGIPAWFENELIKIIKNVKNVNDKIDFQPIFEKFNLKISENKVISTLAFFLDGMYLNHNGILLYWDRKKLINAKSNDFLSSLKNFYNSENFIAPNNIIRIENEVDEDEVTYTIIHKVLIPNNFKIVSVSYPGSQGGGAVLPNPELGKAQPREYPDIIALLPNNSSGKEVLLNESKGMFNKSSIEKDLNKTIRYKTENIFKTALKETLVVAKVIDKNDIIRNILIGVAFGVKTNTKTTWNPDQVDFIFRITDRKKWSIGIFNQSLSNHIRIIEGNTDFPEVYKLSN